MSADLAYATEDLTLLGSDLKTLSDDVKGDGALGEVGVDQVAHQKVVSALEDFAGDWDDRRDKLAESLSAISDLATKAAEELTKVDAELAKEIREALEGEQ